MTMQINCKSDDEATSPLTTRRRFVFGLLSAIILLCSLVLPFAHYTEAKNESNTQVKSWRQKLPELFNWTKFKVSFNKVYPSLRDELARHKLFITSALKTFAHNIVFRWGKSQYYLAINYYSDWTKKEIKRMYNFRHNRSGKNLRHEATKPNELNSNHLDRNGVFEIFEDAIEDTDIEEAKEELARILEEKAEGYEFVAKNLQVKIDELIQQQQQQQQQLKSGRNKRSTNGENNETGENEDFQKLKKRRRKRVGKKLRESAKYVEVVPPTNPFYKPVRLMKGSGSSQSLDSSDQQHEVRPLSEDYINSLDLVSGGVSQVKEKFSSLVTWFNQALDDNKSNNNNERNKFDYDEEHFDEDEYYDDDDDDEDDEDGYANSQENGGDRRTSNSEDTVYLDLRKSGCLTIPRNQLDCGSCYAFATISIMEWMHCDQTGELVPFSEQYMIDCGIYTDLDGCDGGYIYGINKFNMDWGVELLANYPYKEKRLECPYEETQWHQAGYKRPIQTKSNKRDDRKSWPQIMAESGPMLISLSAPEDLHRYGGGIHEGKNCNFGDEELHAVVLVGHGVQNNQDYWILRNSLGHEWGEDGYFRLSKDADSRCFDFGHEFVYDFVTEPAPYEEIDVGLGMKRKLSPSEVQEKIYADIFLEGLTNL